LNADSKVAAVSGRFLYVLDKQQKGSLYDYKNGLKKELAAEYPDTAKYMDQYLRSFLQTYQYVLAVHKTYVDYSLDSLNY